MTDINSQQEKEIGGMQSDIRHISQAVERIENMMISHNKVHAEMNAVLEKRLSTVESWITFVKWGAGALTASIMLFAPGLNKAVQNRPTEDKVVAIIREHTSDFVTKNEGKD